MHIYIETGVWADKTKNFNFFSILLKSVTQKAKQKTAQEKLYATNTTTEFAANSNFYSNSNFDLSNTANLNGDNLKSTSYYHVSP